MFSYLPISKNLLPSRHGHVLGSYPIRLRTNGRTTRSGMVWTHHIRFGTGLESPRVNLCKVLDVLIERFK